MNHRGTKTVLWLGWGWNFGYRKNFDFALNKSGTALYKCIKIIQSIETWNCTIKYPVITLISSDIYAIDILKRGQRKNLLRVHVNTYITYIKSKSNENYTMMHDAFRKNCTFCEWEAFVGYHLVTLHILYVTWYILSWYYLERVRFITSTKLYTFYRWNASCNAIWCLVLVVFTLPHASYNN